MISGTRANSFEEQKKLLKGSNFSVPNLLDAIWANFLLRASTGEYLYGKNPWTYTRCEDKSYQTLIGGGDSSGLDVYYSCYVSNIDGLSGSWKL